MPNIQVKDASKKLRIFYPGLLEVSYDLLLSASTEYNPDFSTEDFFKWLENLNKNVEFNININDLIHLKSWYIDGNLNIRHISGKFFSIEGVKVKTDFNGRSKSWSQPIIVQPEVGFLGIICKKRNGIIYFLMQAKIEPGNVNKIQISPTLQATKSNFTLVHGGAPPPYLNYFKDVSTKRTILVDQLQSEQGARFFRKRNRNMIILMNEDTEIEVYNNFCWLTLGQLKKLLNYPNLVNMDTRTVLSCLQIK